MGNDADEYRVIIARSLIFLLNSDLTSGVPSDPDAILLLQEEYRRINAHVERIKKTPLSSQS